MSSSPAAPADMARAPWAALVWGPNGGTVLLRDDGRVHVRSGSVADMLEEVRGLECRLHPRWVWWEAGPAASPLVRAGIHLARCWDIAEVHRLLAGGWGAGPPLAWAVANGLDPAHAPAPTNGDLFDFAAGSPDGDDVGAVVRPDGHLDPVAGAPDRLAAEPHRVRWAELALMTAGLQADRLAARSPRALSTAYSESAAALMCVELEQHGLPVDRRVLAQLIESAAGPHPESEEHARRIRAARDQVVLRHAPAHPATDLRNPAQVRALLAAVGVHLPDTRARRLEAHRAGHPVVDALLRWRKDERIATTYGHQWMERHVGPDDRLRGAWTACDGAAGRMTAQNGLHNLPAPLRPAVAAHPGHLLVRADLGQIEPRVLAAVSGDRAFAEAARSVDLYAPVALRLGVERTVAKVAVLAAMYGQTSGVAGEALRGLQRSYPAAMSYLADAAAAGEAGHAVQTFGGRRIPVDGASQGDTRASQAARGRFTRNAVVQGAAAELFKAWAATVRAAVGGHGGQIVLCLHDELLIHVPARQADRVSDLVQESLTDAARRWAGSDRVRFVADTSVITRWSEAKG